MRNQFIYTADQPPRLNIKSRFFDELSNDWEYKARKFNARRRRALKDGRIRRHRY